MFEWTIPKKIRVGILLVLVQALCVSCFGLWITARTARKLDVVSSQYLTVTDAAIRLERELLNARIHFIYFITIQKTGALDHGLERLENARTELVGLRTLVAQSDAFANSRPAADQLQRNFDNYKAMLDRMIVIVRKKQNHGPAFDALLSQWAQIGASMVATAGELSRSGSRETNESARQTSTELRRGAGTLGAACFGALLTGLLLNFFITRDVAVSLKKITRALSAATGQIGDASRQISGSAHALASGASKQAASLEETSAASEEINSMARKNAGNSKSAAQNMAEASSRVDEANVNLSQMSASMDQINDSSRKISKIIKVIDEIAFQTNILALNAAVEAARAGEAGMGFAVVADEVRNLAQRSAHAARDTAQLIEESIAKSNDGKMKLDHVAVAVNSITESAARVRGLVDQVESASGEQARGIGQVSRALLEMETLVQSTAAQAQENAAAGGQLKGQSETLRTIVEHLESMVG